jgi:hypothetical protein
MKLAPSGPDPQGVGTLNYRHLIIRGKTPALVLMLLLRLRVRRIRRGPKVSVLTILKKKRAAHGIERPSYNQIRLD